MSQISSRLITSMLAVIFGVSLAIAYEVDSPCDSRLIPTGGKNSYRVREKNVRCEGFYTSRFDRGSSLEPVSFLRGHLDFQRGSTDTLIISTPGKSFGAGAPLRVRATAIPMEIHYRMDAVFDTLESILWPLADVVSGSRLTGDNIGVFGWTGREADKTHVPLDIYRQGDPPPGSGLPLTLAVRSTVQINYLEYSINEVGGGVIKNREKLITQLVFPGEKIEIPIPAGPAADLLVTVRAREYQSTRWLPVLTIKIKRP